MRIRDWSSDVCSSDLADACRARAVERDSLRLRGARLDVRRRLLHDADRPVALYGLGKLGRASGASAQLPAHCFLAVPVAAAGWPSLARLRDLLPRLGGAMVALFRQIGRAHV